MPTVIVWAPVAFAVAIAMDVWAGVLHGKVWHRWLWTVHRSHHIARRGRFERNDLLSALHAPLAIALVLYGCAGPAGVVREILFGIGLGASIFGLAYLLVHDGAIHGRLPIRSLGRVAYLRQVARAHRMHHGRAEGGVPYSLFLGPLELAIHRRLTRAPKGDAARRRGPTARRSSLRARG